MRLPNTAIGIEKAQEKCLHSKEPAFAEHQTTMVFFMRQVADGLVEPAEAVRAYHGELEKKGIRPLRSLEDDSLITEALLKQA